MIATTIIKPTDVFEKNIDYDQKQYWQPTHLQAE
jgi:hypothetical protein